MSFSEIKRHCERTWDTIIIGAGIAGSAAAILAAKAGLEVLLVEAKQFPREKVCGGCLNRRAQLSLQKLDLLDDIRNAGCIALSEIHLQMETASYRWPIPNLLSVRRSTLDTLMVQRAIALGVEFLEGTQASIEPDAPQNTTPQKPNCLNRQVRLKPYQQMDIPVESQEKSQLASARSIVVAAGLTRSPLKPISQWPMWVDPKSRIGVQSIVDYHTLVGQSEDFRRLLDQSQACLHMLASKLGYVGICSTDGDKVDLAAAIDPSLVSSTKSIPKAVSAVLRDCGLCSTEVLMGCEWLATPALTRTSSRVADDGVFVVGDSLGYVEPFTGEGMSWALENAEILTPLLKKAVREPNQRSEAQNHWESYVASHRRVRQRVCRWVAKQARNPSRAKWVLKTFDWIPPLRNRWMKDAVQ